MLSQSPADLFAVNLYNMRLCFTISPTWYVAVGSNSRNPWLISRSTACSFVPFENAFSAAKLFIPAFSMFSLYIKLFMFSISNLYDVSLLDNLRIGVGSSLSLTIIGISGFHGRIIPPSFFLYFILFFRSSICTVISGRASLFCTLYVNDSTKSS